MSVDEKLEELTVKTVRGYKTFKERQQAAEEKAAAKEAAKKENSEQKAARRGEEAAEAKVKRAKGSGAYNFTQTGGAKKGQGRTIVHPPADRPKGKMALKKAKQEKVKKLKETQAIVKKAKEYIASLEI